MKKIGFIDHYLNEWHALNYPEMIERAKQGMNEDFIVAYAYAEKDFGDITTDQFCKMMNVEKCSSIQEICEKSDCLIIFSPDNPERKLDLARQVLPYGKPTFIDKTFAASLEEAKEIYSIAEKYHTPMFSSSSLRFAPEIKEYPDVDSLLIIAPALHPVDYWVHPLEMLVTKMGVGAKKAKLSKSGNILALFLKYENEKNALVIMKDMGPAEGYFISGNGTTHQTMVKLEKPFFDYEMKDILRFFLDGKPSFPKEETLEVMKIRDFALKQIFDEWVEI